MSTPFPTNGTDAEKRAWADAETNPKPKAAAPVVAPKSEEDAIKAILPGGYLRKRGESDTHTDHSRDGR